MPAIATLNNTRTPISLSGAIGELLFFDRVLSDAEREAVECYPGGHYSVAIAHGC